MMHFCKMRLILSLFVLAGLFLATDVFGQCPPVSSTTKRENTSCTGSNADIGVVTATLGVTYQVQRNGANFGAPKTFSSGSGTLFWVANTTTSGTYTIVATSNGCTVNMNGSVSFTPSGGSTPPAVSISLDRSPNPCQGQSVKMTATAGFASYQWKRNGTNISGATTNVYSASTSGTYSVLVGNTCGVTSTTVAPPISVQSTVGAPTTPSGTNSFCQATLGSSTYTSAASGATSYNWSISPSAAGTISGTTGTATVTWSSNFYGTATVSVSANGCGGPSVAVNRYVNISENIKVSNVFKVQGSDCPGNTAQIGVSLSTSETTYTIYRDGTAVDNILVNTGQNMHYLYNTTTPGTYTITATKDGCGSNVAMNGSAVVSYNNATPNVSISLDRSPSPCEGQSVTLTATSGFVSYQWKKNGINISGATTNIHSASTSGNYSVVVGNSCALTTEIAAPPISVQSTVGAPTTPSGTSSFCQGTLSSSIYTSSANGATSYNWSLSPSAAGTISGTTGTATVAWSANFYGTATVSVSANGCNGPSVSVNKSVSISENIKVSNVLKIQGSDCPGSSVQIGVGLSTSETTYTIYRDGTAVDYVLVNTGQNMHYLYSTNTPGTYTITATKSGCGTNVSMSGSVVISFNGNAPSGSISSNGGISGCQGGTILLTATPGYSSYQWLKDGTNINNAITNTFAVTETGAYSVKVKNACNIESTWSFAGITIFPTIQKPTKPIGNNRLCQGIDIQSVYTASSSNATGYNWWVTPSNAGSMNTSSGTINWNPQFSGTATIHVQAYGCNGPSAESILDVEVNGSLGVPLVPMGSTNVCQNSISTYVSSATNAQAYKWELTNAGESILTENGYSSESSSASIKWDRNFLGTATLKVIAMSTEGCSNIATSSQVEIDIVKELDRLTITDGPVNYCAGGQPAKFSASAENVNSFFWTLEPQAAGFINSMGDVTFAEGFLGLVKIHVSAQGCNQVTKETYTTVYVSNNNDCGENFNFVKEFSSTSGSDFQGDIDLLGYSERIEDATYFDGLGRPIQYVKGNFAPNQKDLVQPLQYDFVGRQDRTYLPYTNLVNPYSNETFYRQTAIKKDNTYSQSDQYQYYTQSAPTDVARDGRPFTSIKYEPSPLNRTLNIAGVGDDWNIENNARSYSQKYLLNTYTGSNDPNHEEVIVWTLNSEDLPIPRPPTANVIISGFYESGSLTIEEITDENGNRSRSYYDNIGQLILTKVQSVANPELNDANDWISTYYIYDKYGNIKYVLQPECVRQIGYYIISNSVKKKQLLDQLAFHYEYDGRNRLIKSTAPGAKPVYKVYDERDRLVLSQDGNQRTASGLNWTFTKYDAQNRPIISGIYTHSETIDQEQMSNLVSLTNLYEVYNGEVLTHGYSNTVFPTINGDGSPLDVLSVTYYDNYNFRDDLVGSNFNYSSGDLIGQAPAAFNRVAGLVTGTKTKVLRASSMQSGTNDFLWSVNYYDDKYREIQMITQNQKGGLDRITNTVDFVGKVLETKTTHSIGTLTQTVKKRYEYDHIGRLIKTYHQLGSGEEILLSDTKYNELGQLVTKKLHGESDDSFKQQLDYRYNIKGWVTRINNADLNLSDSGPRDYFGMELGYNNDLGIGTFKPQYNGNISAIKWSANLGLGSTFLNEPKERAYKYSYDAKNRLIEANFNTRVGNWESTLAFREAMGYDHNGNIRSLNRNDDLGSPMDWLNYTYSEGSNPPNQLKSISDQGIITKGFKDKNTSGDDYSYDSNGNVISDKNKEIQTINYNPYLNLTDEIIKESGEKVVYIHSSDGLKIAEEIYKAGEQIPTQRLDYIGPFLYQNDTLKFVIHDEGKIIIPKASTESPEYQYQIKDHLGNIRLTFTAKESTEVFTATMEDTNIANHNNPRVQEMAYFDNLFETEVKNVNQWFNHTSNDVGNAIYLDGSEERTIGPNTLLKVFPGDTVKMEVFAKFENKASHSTVPLTTFLMSLFNPLQSATSSIAEGSTSIVSSLDGLTALFSTKQEDDDIPAAYLNYILFDKDLNVASLAFERIDEVAGFASGSAHSVAFQKLELQKIIDRVGYLYVFVSNESPGSRVWMDDLKITYSQSPIIHFEDYYPFGLSIASTAFERGNDDYKGMVTTDGTGLKDLGFRQYDAAIGRFHALDPLAELQYDQSNYQYAGNNPVSQIDVLGLWPDSDIKDKRKKRKEAKMVNGKKVKVLNGFVNKKQSRTGSTARQKDKQQARAERREQRDQRREKRAKSRYGSGSGESKAETSNNNGAGNSDSNPMQQALINMLLSGSQMKDKTDRPKNYNNPINKSNTIQYSTQPRFENSVTPASMFDNSDNNRVSPFLLAADIGDKVSNEEQYRQYLTSHLSTIEGQALFYHRQANQGYNPQSNIQETRFNENITVRSNTTTTEDEILDPQQKPPRTSTTAEALAKIQEKEGTLPENSAHFSNVSRQEFLDQLKARVAEGGHKKTNQGFDTNFCWAAAIAKQAYEKDPKGMAEAMINLYETGIFVYNNNNGGMNVPKASSEARNAVGGSPFDGNQNVKKGRTINELDQMLFMTLADAGKYKGGTNLDLNYDPDDEEDPAWSGKVLGAAVKIWNDFGFDVEATGVNAGWWITPQSKVSMTKDALATNDVVLFVNSNVFKEGSLFNPFATHYIHVSSIVEISDNDPMTIDKIEVKYWDYGSPHTIQMYPEQFERSLYGIIKIPKTND